MVYIASDGKEFTNQKRLDEWEEYLITGIPIVKSIRKPSKPRIKKDKPVIDKQELLYKRYINDSIKRKKEFDLSYDVFITLINKPCIYCGKEQCNGVDRLNSNIGYIKSNCNSCCYVCNLMKHSHTEEFFLDHLKKILNNKINK